jgi:hypothetical protein
MLGQAHAGLGWIIGVAAPDSDRRIRIGCTLAAILPDADALTLLAGKEAYDRFHHTFGHNVFTGALCVGGAAWFFRRYPFRTGLEAVLLVALSFASHLITDMKLSGWPVCLFWPLSRHGYQFVPNLELGSPINLALAVVLMALPWVLAAWKGVTPLEIVSPRLDWLFLNLFRPRKHECSACRRPSNNRCSACTRPVCLRHGRIDWRFRVTCPLCAAGSSKPTPADGVEDYLARHLKFLRSPEAKRLDAEFAAFIDQKLSNGLKRLNSVPRDHPLWLGSNQQPTFAKVVDLCRHLLREAPDDEEAMWVLFADKVLSSSADLGFSAIEPLILRDLGSLRWLVAAARWSYVLSGVDPVVALREPLERLGKSVGSLDVCLEELGRDPLARTREAALACAEIRQGKNPFKATARA